MAIHRGQVLAYDSTNHKADVLLLGSMSGVVRNVPIAQHIEGHLVTVDASCAVAFFGEGSGGLVFAMIDAAVVSACRVYNSAGISTGSGTWTYLTFDSERYDTDGIHSTVSNTGRLTAQTAGVYVIKGSVRWSSNNTGARGLQIRLNGTAPIAVHDVANAGIGFDFLTIPGDWYFNVNDYVELGTYQSSGGPLNVDAASWYSPEFMMAKIG